MITPMVMMTLMVAATALAFPPIFPRTLWPRKAEKRGLLAENSSWQLGKNSDAAKRFPGITLHETEFNFVMKLVGSAR